MSVTFPTVTTIGALFTTAASANPAQPLLTWYSPQERTELSGATLANWVAKTANLLVNECGLGPGDHFTADLPPHWQTAAILLGAWTAGLEPGTPADVSFGLSDSKADYLVGLHPFALPVPNVSAPSQDWVLSARAHGDHFSPIPVAPQPLAAQALAAATDLGLSPGDRVLVNVDTSPFDLSFLVPFAAIASVVLCTGLDPAALAKIAHTEHALPLPPL
jgi:uncharacterized protein (TIGR03089 family)